MLPPAPVFQLLLTLLLLFLGSVVVPTEAVDTNDMARMSIPLRAVNGTNVGFVDLHFRLLNDPPTLCIAVRSLTPMTGASIRFGAAGVRGPVAVDFQVATKGTSHCLLVKRTLQQEMIDRPASFYLFSVLAGSKTSMRSQLAALCPQVRSPDLVHFAFNQSVPNPMLEGTIKLSRAGDAICYTIDMASGVGPLAVPQTMGIFAILNKTHTAAAPVLSFDFAQSTLCGCGLPVEEKLRRHILSRSTRYLLGATTAAHPAPVYTALSRES